MKSASEIFLLVLRSVSKNVFSFMELLVSSPSPLQIFLKVAEDSGVDAAELSGWQQLLSMLLL